MLLERLRDQTRPIHERLEVSERMRALMRPTIDIDEYSRHLLDVHGFVVPFERRLLADAPRVSARFSYERRIKTSLLERDLIFLACPIPHVTDDSSWHFSRPEEAIGAMYVMEGATLGGRYICEHLEAALGLRADRGLAYFHSYGKARGRMWNEFRENVETWFAEGTLDAPLVVLSAIETFERFEEWMNG